MRSIAGVHICQALEKCREHLIAFGGHARAAGMEVAPDRIPELRPALNHAIPLAPEEMVPEVVVDAEVKLRELTVPTIREMGKLAPFGNGNRRPLLAARDLVVAGSPRIMGQQGQHLSFLVRDGDDAGPPRAVRAVAFGRGEAARELSRQGLRIDLAFDAALDTWGGEEKVQLNVKEIRYALVFQMPFPFLLALGGLFDEFVDVRARLDRIPPGEAGPPDF